MHPSNAKPPVSRESTALRLTFLGALVVTLFVLLVARLWFLQVMTGSQFVAQAENQSIRTIEIEAPRGDIVDRDGTPIVNTRYAQVVSVRPDQMGDEETRAATVAELARILAMPVDEVNARVEDQTVGPFANRPIAIDVPAEVILYIHQNGATRFPGVIAERIPLREYPQGPLAPHVAGYTGQISAEQLAEEAFADYGQGDIIGWAGVEASYEQYLRGTNGERRVRVNNRGEILEDMTDDNAPQALPGDTVQLTLDADVQRITEQALEAGIMLARDTPDNEGGAGRGGFFQAPAGAAVVLDPDTGEVVAMASYPTFDPEQFVGGVSQRYWDFLQAQESHYPLINRPIAASYPPGSVYKIITSAAALAYDFVEQDDYIPCPGEYAWADNVYRNWTPVDQGSLNMAESLMRSCDTVYYHLARQMFDEEVNTELGQNYNNRVVQAIETGEAPEFPFEYLAEMSRAFGLDAITDIDLPGERNGVVPGREWRFDYWLDARDNYCAQAQTAAPATYEAELFAELCSVQGALWRGGDLVNMSIGQGDLQTTPLQIANMFAAVANRGPVMVPHVVRAVLDEGDEPVMVNDPQLLHTVPVTAEDLDVIERGMVAVTQSEDGTAWRVFEDFGIPIAGKTGTAENKPRQPYAWFGGYNMELIDGEQYVVVAFVEEGGGGSAIAAPIVEQIFAGLADVDVELQAGEITE
ncbi:MAG TPA: penicillin-binding protein 2 [Euzebya sp.]|nr:penicillin-binding protein 2 [Euzebya sp.]